jgi:hypothetical protein
MRKFLLNLAPGEPLALVQELRCFDDSIKLDPLLLSALDTYVSTIRSLYYYCMQLGLSSVGVSYSATSKVSNNGGK